MSTAKIQGKGAYVVRSGLYRPDLLPEPAFIAWYEEDHIPEVTSTSGIRSARRLVCVDPGVAKPYLAVYPMDDLAFTQTQEFKDIHVTSDMLPGDNAIYDLADFEIRGDRLVHVHEHRNATGATKTVLFVASQLKESSDGGISADEFDRWYRDEYCPSLQKHKNYLRTTRFELAFSRNNHQARVQKGLVSADAEGPPEPGTWLALHEFDCEPDEVGIQELEQLTASQQSGSVSASLARQDIWKYRLVNEFGKKDWFYGVDM